MTILGTIKKNKSEIPKEMIDLRKREIGSSRFCFNGLLSITSFVPKKNRVVLMLSTEDISIDNDDGKPDVVKQYNVEKNGVDGLDKKVSAYTCVRSTRKWPQRIFQNLLDITTVNGHCVYLEMMKRDQILNDQNKKSSQFRRDKYIYNLILELIEPHIRERSITFLSNELKDKLNNLKEKIDNVMNSYEGYIPLKQNSSSEIPKNVLSDCSQNLNKPKRKQCVDCKEIKRETSLRCSKCMKPKCSSHLNVQYTCIDCMIKYD